MVRVTPLSPLTSEKSYEVIVVAGDLLSATGRIIGSGPRDLVDRPLVVPFRSTFTTADNDPPALLSLFPSNNAVQVDIRAVPRLSFNEAVQAAGFSFTLNGPGGNVTGKAAVGVDGRVLSFVPAPLLKPNATYTLTVSNVFDLAGNRAAGEPIVSVFNTLDTVGPDIAILRVGDGRTPLAGSTVPIEAVLETPEGGAFVRFTQDFQPIGTSTNEPFRVSAKLPLIGRATFRAIATDRFGNDGAVATLVVDVRTNEPPTIQFVRVLPASGPVPSGSAFTVDVMAEDDSGIAKVKAIVAGIGTSELIETNASALRVQGLVSADAGPGAAIAIFAEATDDIGQSSGERELALDISDGTPPALSIASPAPQSLVTPGAVTPVTLDLKDNFGVSRVDVVVTGAFTSRVQSAVSPIITNGLTVVDVAAPADAPTNHEPVLLSVSARDGAGNVSPLVTRTLRMIDATPPAIVSITPPDGASDVDLQPVIEIVFSEPLDINTVNGTNVVLAIDANGDGVVTTLSLQPDLKTLRMTPTAPLGVDTQYGVTITTALADASGNPLGAESVTTFHTVTDRDTDGDGALDGMDRDPLVANQPPVAGEVQAEAALSFDGVDDFVRVGDVLDAGSGSFTLEVWYLKSTAETNLMKLVNKGLTSSGNPENAGYHIRIRGGLLEFGVHDGARTIGVQVPEPTINMWHHVAGVLDRTTRTESLYVDGARVAKRTYDVLGSLNTDRVLGFGALDRAPDPPVTEFFEGELAEVSVWSRALTQAELRHRFNRFLTGSEEGLIGYWPLNEGSGGSTSDRSASRLVGQLGGGDAGQSPQWVGAAFDRVVDPSASTLKNTGLTLTLPGVDLDGDALTATIVSLPSHGTLFQTPDGITRGASLTAVPANVIDPGRRILYEPPIAFEGLDSFAFVVNDGQEDSGPADYHLRVGGGNRLPTAVDDAAQTFQDAPVVIDDLVENDTDPDGDFLHAVVARPPGHGVLAANPDGSFTYTPNPGFVGTDTFTYGVVDAEAWNRALDFTPGTTQGSTDGNPDDDVFGDPVWQMESVQGGALTENPPWYAASGQKMVWDSSWFGGGRLWARGNDLNPPISAAALTHTIPDGGTWSHIPLVRWLNPAGRQAVDIVGELRVRWAGSGRVGSPVPVDVAVAKKAALSGVVFAIYTNTVNKPTPGDSIDDMVVLPVRLANVSLEAGDQIIVSHRAQHSVNASRWINLADDLTILPSSPSRYATVTIEVEANRAPAVAVASGTALRFDASDDFARVPDDDRLDFGTGDFTVEAWINVDGSQLSQQTEYGVVGKNSFFEGVPGWGIEISTWGEFPDFAVAGFNTGQDMWCDSCARTGTLQPGRWYHVALVRVSGELKIHVDGRDVAVNSDAASGRDVDNDQPLVIGNHAWGPAFPGLIDEVRVWSRALGVTEIQDQSLHQLAGNEPGLVLYLPFDEGSGAAANDVTGNGLVASLGNGNTAQSPVWTNEPAPVQAIATTVMNQDVTVTLPGTDGDGDPLAAFVTGWPAHGLLFQTADGVTRSASLLGEAGHALRFDGVNDSVRIGDDPRLVMSNAFTVATWMRPEGTGNGGKQSGGILVNKEGEYEVARYADGTIRWAIANSDPGWFFISSDFVAPLGQWTHIAVTYDGSRVVTYADGTLVKEQSASGAIDDFLTRENEFWIGGRSGQPEFFDGLIDDVGIWNRALSAAEVREVAAHSVDGTEPGLVGFWRFDDGSGVSTADAGPNGLHGVLGGGASTREPSWQLSDAPVDGPFRAAVIDPGRRVIYAPETDFVGSDFIRYVVNDGKVDSAEGELTVLVSPGSGPLDPLAITRPGKVTETGVAGDRLPIGAGQVARPRLRIQVDGVARQPGIVRPEAVTGGRPLVLTWDALPKQTFVLECSRDLEHWERCEAVIERPSVGSRRAVINRSGAEVYFYRLKLEGKTDKRTERRTGNGGGF